MGRPESASTLCFGAVVMASFKKLDVGPLCLRFFSLALTKAAVQSLSNNLRVDPLAILT